MTQTLEQLAITAEQIAAALVEARETLAKALAEHKLSCEGFARNALIRGNLSGGGEAVSNASLAAVYRSRVRRAEDLVAGLELLAEQAQS